MGQRKQVEREMEPKRKKIKLQNKATEEVRVLEVVQKDSIQGFWCVESVDLWKWYPHDQWKEIR